MRRFILPTAIIALTLLFFWKLAFTDLILARGDTYYFFYPLWAARDQAFQAGQLPLWTNNVFMGAPLLSDPQPGTLYPPNWLTIPLAPPDAIRISILLHVTWATTGATLLARRSLKLDFLPALIAGAVFGLGGYIGAHVEQINQLQGLAWLPWALLTFALALDRPWRYTPLLAAIFALQVLSGHTQTVFLTGFALGLYGLVDTIQTRAWRTMPLLSQFLKFGVILVGAVGLAALLAIPQLYPTLELTGLSNRGGGFNPQQAMAFSWNPFLAGRGLLPGYDAQVFGEYVAYTGIIALGLALYGMVAGDQRKWRWLVLIGIGIFFAFGLYNPLYWTLAGLPGFNLFRVPARWLVLFAIGAAMLAGLGAQTLMQTRPRWRDLSIIGGIIGLIAASTLLSDRAANEVDGTAVPGLLTFGLWGAALALLLGLLRWRSPFALKILPVVVIGELFLASLAMPYNDLAAPEAYHDARMSIHQLQAYCGDAALCDRVLSISGGFFDPGDKAAMTERYTSLTERANRYAFTAAKMKELVAPNLPLVWDVPSVDGAGGGIIPTSYYTQFTSLMLPEGLPRSIDGRLREFLALPDCNGACIPEQRWLNLTNTRYLILDKVYDLWQDGIAYDTAFTLLPGESFEVQTDFVGTALHLLYTGAPPQIVLADGETLVAIPAGEIGAFQFAQISLDETQALTSIQYLSDDPESRLRALTLVDTRTGDFMQIPLGSWRLALSSDIKLYENLDVLPRAFVVPNAQFTPDTWDGTEAALRLMRDPAFDPTQTVILAGDGVDSDGAAATESLPAVTTVSYTATEARFTVDAPNGGYLLVTDAYYPGWQATVNGESAPLYRADVMFRAVRLMPGVNEVHFTYAPDWLKWVFPVSGLAWLAVIGVTGSWFFHRRDD